MPTLSDFTATTITGEEQPLDDLRRARWPSSSTPPPSAASRPQFEGLEKLHQEYADQGLVVLGFPCNQFGSQDPGSNEEIGAFCQRNYGVSFPMFAKVDVNGDDAHPLYQWLRVGEGRPARRQDQVELHQVPGRPRRPGDQALRLDHQAREDRRRHREGARRLSLPAPPCSGARYCAVTWRSTAAANRSPGDDAARAHRGGDRVPRGDADLLHHQDPPGAPRHDRAPAGTSARRRSSSRSGS